MTIFEYYEGEEDVQWFPEASTQSFLKGQLVYLSSGKLTACASNAQAILGVAQEDASETENTWLPVMLAHSTTMFVGSSTNAGSDVTAAITHLLKDCELYVSTNTSYVDIGTTSTNGLRTVAFHPDHIPNTATATIVEPTNAKVIFKVINAYSQATDLDAS